MNRADISVPSCPQRPETQEGTRALPRTDQWPNLHARATNLLHRICKHQPRNSRRHEERRRGYEADPWQNDYGGCGYYDVGLTPFPTLKEDSTDVGGAGNNSANNTNSRKKSATPSPPCPSPSLSTKTNWRPTWRRWSRRTWMRRC